MCLLRLLQSERSRRPGFSVTHEGENLLNLKRLQLRGGCESEVRSGQGPVICLKSCLWTGCDWHFFDLLGFVMPDSLLSNGCNNLMNHIQGARPHQNRLIKHIAWLYFHTYYWKKSQSVCAHLFLCRRDEAQRSGPTITPGPPASLCCRPLQPASVHWQPKLPRTDRYGCQT